MKCKSLTQQERVYADRKSVLIEEFLNTHDCNFDDCYGTAALAFIRAVKFCFRFSCFTDDQFASIAELFMQEAVALVSSPLEIVNLDDVTEASYHIEEDITDQTVQIAAEQFMNVKMVQHLLRTAEPEEKRIMELICQGKSNSQILHSQGISQEDYDIILANIRSRIPCAA